MVDKTRNGGKWTDARFRQFIITALRAATKRWGPKHEVKRKARVARGRYLCACCGEVGPATLPPLEGRKRRRNNAAVDHIDPVIDPCVGFVDWNTFIERMFCEESGLQVMCWECHAKKTEGERSLSVARRKDEAGK